MKKTSIFQELQTGWDYVVGFSPIRYAMAFIGMTPFGSLMAGSLAKSIGAPGTVIIGGALCMICAGSA